MKTLRYLIIILVPLFIISCLTDTEEEDCICTEEFRTINVIVVDEQDNPVSNLITAVNDTSGKSYDLSGISPFNGYYPVMSDKYVNDFSTEPKKILFEGVKDSLSVNGEFFINADDCKCHVYKVRGPDTLVIM